MYTDTKNTKLSPQTKTFLFTLLAFTISLPLRADTSSGTLSIANVSKNSGAVKQFCESVGDGKQILVVGNDDATALQFRRQLATLPDLSITFVPKCERNELIEQAKSLDGVWLSNETDGETVSALADRGLFVGCDSAVAESLCSRTDHQRSDDRVPSVEEFCLLSRIRFILGDGLNEGRESDSSRLIIKVPDGAQLFVSGRRLWSLGVPCLVELPAAEGSDTTESISIGKQKVDLVALQRQLRNRTVGQRPTSEVRPLTAGALLLAGGGQLPDSVVRCFVELAGSDEANIVVLPTAVSDPIPEEQWIAKRFLAIGAGSVTVLPERKRADVESDKFLAAMNEATAIWFGGGRQWRFVDAYEGTKALDAMHAVLSRGGVIGGSSAGASIQADYLARGNPLGNRNIMAKGYERGFAFLSGTAVDQHFTKRGRIGEMQELVRAHPEVLGIGIDEQTAIVVQGANARVVGQGNVFFISPRLAASSDQDNAPVVKLEAGDIFNLVEFVVESVTPP
ncbi:MAG: cyanophycinase [Planctomycetales bacterium]|nr:cyanophycinase [Planctomycetales bacterium]